VLDDVSLTWLRLNERRSSLHERSKVNDSAARKQTFAAAMTQFEEQFAAAKAVTAATRPLNLYYGLAQAGMAIAAAHASDPRGFNRHGLRLGDRNPELADMMVEPDGEGAFQKVAAATGSPGITEPVSLGALWASLPDLSQIGTLPGSMRPEPLIVLADEAPARRPRATLLLPGEMPSEGRAFVARFGEIMTSYPGAAGVAIPMDGDSVRPPGQPGGNWQVTVRWPTADSQQEMSEEELKAFYDEVAPEYRYRGDRFLRPAIDAARTAPPSPLMTWWLLLYSFSMLARYEPRRWTKLLDLDASKVAVLLRYALEEALGAMPQLVLEALDGKSTLLAKPMAF
jgi:hypothetical protein